VKDRDPVLHDQLHQGVTGGSHTGWGDDQASSRLQWPEDLDERHGEAEGRFQQVPVVFGQATNTLPPRLAPSAPAMRLHHPFRLPRRSRRVEYESEVALRRVGVRAARALPRDEMPIAVEADSVRSMLLGKLLASRRLGQNDWWSGVLQHQSKPLLWVRRIHRHACAAGLEHAE
jgi:hypothetical protein